MIRDLLYLILSWFRTSRLTHIPLGYFTGIGPVKQRWRTWVNVSSFYWHNFVCIISTSDAPLTGSPIMFNGGNIHDYPCVWSFRFSQTRIIIWSWIYTHISFREKNLLNVVFRSHLYTPGDHLDIKMSSYQYRDSHVKDKTVSRPSYL